MRTLRISHPAFFGIYSSATIRFYTEILGVRIVLRQPNLDDGSLEHVFFHVGEDNFIAYFLPYDEAAAADKYQRMKPGYGVMNHLALDVDAPSFDSAIARLTAEGIEALKEVSGSIDTVLAELIGGVQSGMGYLGAGTLAELRAKARFIRVSPAGQKEAAPHDVIEVSTRMSSA